MENETLDTADGARANTITDDIISKEAIPQTENATTMNIDLKEQDLATKQDTATGEGTLKDLPVAEEAVAMKDPTVDEVESPPLTHALEALLGGLEPAKPQEREIATTQDTLPISDINMEEVQTDSAEKPTAEDTNDPRMEIADLTKRTQTFPEKPAPVENRVATEDISMAMVLAAPEGEEGEEGEHPEWEIDSSPIESSSDDSSSDSSDESDDGDNEMLLSVEEQAKILMEGDGGSDDEGGGKAKGSGGPLRTKNEVPEVVVPKPDVTITPEMRIEELGAVETIVGNILLIKAKTSGEYRVLESGSVLCLEDRSVIGAVAETLGRVQQPLYSVMFTNATELQAAGLALGTKVFYTDQHSTYVFTQALKSYKGSDASNLHDEEVGDDEVEFSDDEAEAAHKRKVKQMKAERRGGKAQQNGAPRRGGHPLQQQHQPYNAAQGINYDDTEDEGPYKTLARPTGYADSVGRSEAPQEGSYNSQERPSSSRDNFRGRGRGDNRGRGDRGRGRGDRGRGRGEHQERRSEGYSLPPKPPQGFQPTPPGVGIPPFPQAPGAMPNFYAPQNLPQYSPMQPQLGWPQYPSPFPQYQNMQNWPNMPPVIPPAQNGAYINPAFFSNGQASSPPPQWSQQNQNGNGKGK